MCGSVTKHISFCQAMLIVRTMCFGAQNHQLKSYRGHCTHCNAQHGWPYQNLRSNVGSYQGYLAAPRRGRRRNSSGGIPPVKCRHLADRSCTNGATRRIYHVLVYKSRTKTTQIRVSYYLKWRLLADRSCISVAPLRIVHKLILSKFVSYFLNYVKMALGQRSRDKIKVK